MVRTLALILTLGAATAQAEPIAIEVKSSRIEAFQIGSTETKFGPFTFVGGLEMTSYDRNFGSLSGWRFRRAAIGGGDGDRGLREGRRAHDGERADEQEETKCFHGGDEFGVFRAPSQTCWRVVTSRHRAPLKRERFA